MYLILSIAAMLRVPFKTDCSYPGGQEILILRKLMTRSHRTERCCSVPGAVKKFITTRYRSKTLATVKKTPYTLGHCL